MMGVTRPPRCVPPLCFWRIVEVKCWCHCKQSRPPARHAVIKPYMKSDFKNHLLVDFSRVSALMQPRGFIFGTGFSGEVLFKFDLPGVLIEMGFC